MNLHKVIQSQYLAALEMLKQAVTHCPQELWNYPEDKTRFWHIAYHAVFYAHLYVQESEHTFTPWEKHRAEYNFLGPLPWSPHALPQIGEPYTQDEVLEYLGYCQQQILEIVPKLNLEGESGFSWLLFSKLELQIYSIRHIQQHAGELMERLGGRAGVELDWVGRAQ